MTFLLFTLSILCVWLPFWCGNRYGVVRLVSPLHIVSYLAFFGILTKTFYLQVLDGEMFFHRYLANEENVLDGYFFISGFIVFVCLGYVTMVRKVWRIQRDDVVIAAVKAVRQPELLVILSFCVAAAVIAQLLAVRGLGGLTSAFSLATIDAMNSSKIVKIEGVEGYGASLSAIKVFLFLPTLALTIYIARYTLWRRPSDLMIMLLLLGLEVFLTLMEGKRFALVLTLATFVTMASLLGQRFSVGSLVKAGVGVVAVLALFLMMTSFRASREDTQDVSFDPDIAMKQVFGSTYFLDINVPILIIKQSNPDERFLGDSYFYWTYAWIPRQFWPGKPVVTLGPYVKQEVLGIRGSYGGINPTGPGEAFLNFGWFGMGIGFLLGMAYRKVETVLLSPKGLKTLGGLWQYPVVVFPMVIGTLQSSFSASLTPIFITYVMIRLVLYALKFRLSLGRQTQRPAPSWSATERIDAPR